MSKLRVYELAKKLDVNTKDIINTLKEHDINVQSHMSTLKEKEIELVMKYFSKDAIKEENRETDKKENTEVSKKEEHQALSKKQENKESSKQQTEEIKNQKKHDKVQKTPKSLKQREILLDDEEIDHELPKIKNHSKSVDKSKAKKIIKEQSNDLTGKETQKSKGKPGFKANNRQNGKQELKQEVKEVKEIKEEKKEDKQEETIKIVQLPQTISIKDLAQKIGEAPTALIKSLMKKGTIVTINQEIDYELASQLAEEYNVLTEPEQEVDILEEVFGKSEDNPADLVERPPVVVVMGHVDHGKTSLLDAIRSTNVTSKEAGGITQHIGASSISINNKKITFLDTPGHEAFTAMRMRGAQVTDIAVLVVAADDGVMPQTIEAINHARAANLQIIVAINKMDKPGANPDRVKQELADQGLLVEEWGGDVICVPVSATKKEGIDTLLDMILLVGEMSDLKANPNKKARGTIIESQLDKGRGPVATVLVQDGTLKVGDPLVAGTAYGRVRAMIDDKGRNIKKATPSTPVEILGLSEVPMAGDMFYVANSDKQARQIAEKIKAQGKQQLTGQTPHKVSLDDLYQQIQDGKIKDLNIIIKADVQGSVEAVRQSLQKLSNDEVRIKIIHGGVGAITEYDVMLASASGAIIIGFNVRPEASTKAMAEREQVDIRLYRVIYNAIEDIQAAIKGMLEPEFVEKVTGHAEIRQTFKVSGIGTIGGSYVTDGKIQRNSKVRIIRDGIVVYEGHLSSLKRFKDDVKEVSANYECGLTFEKFNDIKIGDIVEAYVLEEIPR